MPGGQGARPWAEGNAAAQAFLKEVVAGCKVVMTGEWNLGFVEAAGNGGKGWQLTHSLYGELAARAHGGIGWSKGDNKQISIQTMRCKLSPLYFPIPPLCSSSLFPLPCRIWGLKASQIDWPQLQPDPNVLRALTRLGAHCRQTYNLDPPGPICRLQQVLDGVRRLCRDRYDGCLSQILHRAACARKRRDGAEQEIVGCFGGHVSALSLFQLVRSGTNQETASRTDSSAPCVVALTYG